MKIAVCLDTIQPRDGTSHFAMQLGDTLASAGHLVTMIAVRPQSLDLSGRQPSLRFYSIGQRQWESKAAQLQRIARFFRAQAFAVAFICTGLPLPDLERALNLLPDATAIVPVLGDDREHAYAPTQRSAAACNVVVAESPRLRQTIQARLPEKPVRLLTTAIVHPTDGELVGRLPFTGLDAGPLRLLFVGRMVGRKNVYMLSKILAATIEKGIAATLTVCGNGPDREPLMRTCHELGFAHLVDFPSVPHQPELYDLYRRHHLLLWPSSYGEGLGLVLLEAQANGCVPVASRLLGVTDFTLADGETGLLAEEKNVEDFARQIGQLTDPVRWQRFSQAGIVRTRHLFTEQAMMRDYAALLAEIAQGHYPLPAPRSSLPRPVFSRREYVPPPLYFFARSLWHRARRFRQR